MTKGKRITVLTLLGLVLFSGVTLGVTYWYSKRSSATPIKVQFAYPVTSITPTEYDDWESNFIGNHIYRRLLPETNRKWIGSVTHKLNIECEQPGMSSDSERCTFVRISFQPTEFEDCLGRKYGLEEIRDEFERLLKAKAWALPDSTRCEAKSNEICIRGRNTQDIERRMRNVNFRFGWSKSTVTDSIFGAGPYCLHSRTQGNNTFLKGTLKNQTKTLPDIEFDVSQDPKDDFHLAIYGSKALLGGKRKNVQAHTPLAYYVVTNPKHAQKSLPWNTTATKDVLHSFLVSYEVFFPDGKALAQLVPSGAALNIKTKSASKPLDFVIPNYLPACDHLAEQLSKLWAGKSTVRCVDIVTFVMEKVRGSARDWDAFLVGVSASDPGRNSIGIQYFSSWSPESWTYKDPSPQDFYYLVGMGQSIVTVDGETICDVRPNLLGLGDIFVTDLLPCIGERK